MERNRRTGKSTILVNDVAVKERSHYICLTLTPTPSLMVYNVNPKCIIAFIVSSHPPVDTPANDSDYLLQGFVSGSGNS